MSRHPFGIAYSLNVLARPAARHPGPNNVNRVVRTNTPLHSMLRDTLSRRSHQTLLLETDRCRLRSGINALLIYSVNEAMQAAAHAAEEWLRPVVAGLKPLDCPLRVRYRTGGLPAPTAGAVRWRHHDFCASSHRSSAGVSGPVIGPSIIPLRQRGPVPQSSRPATASRAGAAHRPAR
jgi:hypothetical protein